MADEDLKTAWESFHPEVEARAIQVVNEDDTKDVRKTASKGDDFSKLTKDRSTGTTAKKDGGKVKSGSTTITVSAKVEEAVFKLKDGQVSDMITSTNASTYTTEYYIVETVKNQSKDNDVDKYKKELKEIATNTKLSDSAFQNKIVGEVLKNASVKIKDRGFENIPSTLTSDSSTASNRQVV